MDAVYISLPNTMHVDWSIRSVEAGKHVLCEKPLTRTPADAERAFDAADRAGRILMEAFMYRHNPQIKRLRALIDEGAVGEVRLIRSAFSLLAVRPGQHPAAHRRRGRRADGRRLLLRQRLTARRRRGAGVGLRRRLVRADRNRLGLHRVAALSRRRARHVRLRHGAAEPRRARGDRQRSSLFLDDPWHANDPGDRAAPRRRHRARSGSTARTRTSSSSRTSPTRSPARPSCCSAATTRSARRGRSPPSTPARSAASRFRSGS